MNLLTTGVTNYSGWMAKAPTITIGAGQLHHKMVSSFNFSSGVVTEIQAHEIGRRAVNAAGITDNGQTQFVPLGNGTMEFDVVPSPSGGWADTGCRFTMFAGSTLYTQEFYWVNDFNGALSLVYTSLNGVFCYIPPSLQHIAGASLGWTPLAAVAAFQPDAKPTASAAFFGEDITVSYYSW